MLHLIALLGVLSISFSAVFVRLAAVSPVTSTFYRAAYAAPILVVIWLIERSADRRGARERWLAVASGLVLAVDLAVWHESIALVGAGLGTVIANVQVVFVAAAAWLLFGERPTSSRLFLIAVVLGGVVLTSGLARHDAYGSSPVAGAVACAVFDRHFTFAPGRAAHLWLALLAIGSQVIGWLLIGRALPELPAIETSILLLGQPIFAVIWGVLLFDERLSALQWLGSAIVLAGVATLSVQAMPPRRNP